MSEEDMQRTLVAEFPPLTFATDRDGAVTTIVNNGYHNQSVTGTALFYQEVQIDLSGYALDKKTFFPYSSFEQRNGPTIGSFTADDRNIYDTMIVSSIPLSEEQVAMNSYVQDLPGFTVTNIGIPILDKAYRINRDPLMHQHQLIQSHDSTTANPAGSSIYRVTSSVNGSSLEPTAADVLYCYRILFCKGTDGSGFLPAARVLLPGTISSEPTLEYMMRLKRSYELANQV